jgi:hypothetical protein
MPPPVFAIGRGSNLFVLVDKVVVEKVLGSLAQPL